jgi:hypothetical protein
MHYVLNPEINTDSMKYYGILPYTYNEIYAIFGKEYNKCVWPIQCYFNKNICLSFNDNDNVISLYGDQGISHDNILDISDYIYGHSLEDFNTNNFLSDFITKHSKSI